MNAAADSIFFKRTFDEVVGLLVETRAYLSSIDPASLPGLTPEERLQSSAESMRVTARLAQIMSWMLAQKAAAAGEISLAEASGPSFAVPDDPTCLAETDMQASRLPPNLLDLMDRSRRLYVRVRHLNGLVVRSLANAG